MTSRKILIRVCRFLTFFFCSFFLNILMSSLDHTLFLPTLILLNLSEFRIAIYSVSTVFLFFCANSYKIWITLKHFSFPLLNLNIKNRSRGWYEATEDTSEVKSQVCSKIRTSWCLPTFFQNGKDFL